MGNKLIANIKHILLDLISFDTPQAKVFNFSLILIIALLVPTDKLVYLPIFSVYQTFFHLTLYSSGMTRAMSRLMHGDLDGALAFNKLVLLVFLVIISLLFINLKRSIDYYGRTGRIYKYF